MAQSSFARLLKLSSVKLFCFFQVIAVSLPAAADHCAPREILLEQYRKDHQETPRSGGPLHSGTFLEVLVSEDDSTWTIIVTGPDMTSCPLAIGTDWRQAEQ